MLLGVIWSGGPRFRLRNLVLSSSQDCSAYVLSWRLDFSAHLSAPCALNTPPICRNSYALDGVCFQHTARSSLILLLFLIQSFVGEAAFLSLAWGLCELAQQPITTSETTKCGRSES